MCLAVHKSRIFVPCVGKVEGATHSIFVVKHTTYYYCILEQWWWHLIHVANSSASPLLSKTHWTQSWLFCWRVSIDLQYQKRNPPDNPCWSRIPLLLRASTLTKVNARPIGVRTFCSNFYQLFYSWILVISPYYSFILPYWSYNYSTKRPKSTCIKWRRVSMYTSLSS